MCPPCTAVMRLCPILLLFVPAALGQPCASINPGGSNVWHDLGTGLKHFVYIVDVAVWRPWMTLTMTFVPAPAYSTDGNQEG